MTKSPTNPPGVRVGHLMWNNYREVFDKYIFNSRKRTLNVHCLIVLIKWLSLTVWTQITRLCSYIYTIPMVPYTTIVTSNSPLYLISFIFVDSTTHTTKINSLASDALFFTFQVWAAFSAPRFPLIVSALTKAQPPLLVKVAPLICKTFWVNNGVTLELFLITADGGGKKLELGLDSDTSCSGFK